MRGLEVVSAGLWWKNDKGLVILGGLDTGCFVNMGVWDGPEVSKIRKFTSASTLSSYSRCAYYVGGT